MSQATMPEIVIEDLIQLGIKGLRADPTEIDKILAQLPAAQQTIARDWWARHEPVVMQGFARTDSRLPAYAITIQADNPSTEYLGFGEEAGEDFLGGGGADEFYTRDTSTFAIYCYALSAESCVWMYRILRRIIRVGSQYLITNGLDNPRTTGADLAPDPKYTPANVAVRVLRLQVDYEESWESGGSLWETVYGTVDRTPGTAVRIFHEDVAGTVEDPSEGTATPYTSD